MMAKMLQDIAGNVAIVTGASRGIGRAIAIMLADEGCHVALMARSADGLEETAKMCRSKNAEALTVAVDIRDVDQLHRGVEDTVRKFGRLNILVNNAGVGLLESSLNADAAKYRKVIETNLIGSMNATVFSLPHIKQQGSGSIIFIASISAKITYAEGAAYCASKHGILGFAGCVFEDVRRHNIKVCSICPGYVDTEMVADIGLNKKEIIQPEDVAEAVRMVVKFPSNSCPTEIILRSQLGEV
jgi:3-oxoacyl-[acyl-carrier protein] reductase